jgi:hypothetical protein
MGDAARISLTHQPMDSVHKQDFPVLLLVPLHHCTTVALMPSSEPNLKAVIKAEHVEVAWFKILGCIAQRILYIKGRMETGMSYNVTHPCENFGTLSSDGSYLSIAGFRKYMVR